MDANRPANRPIYIEIIDRRYKPRDLYNNTTMTNNYSNNDKHSNKSIIIPSRMQLTYHNLHKLQNIVKWKDQRLELIEIPKGLIEILQNAGFTIEKILDSCPADIAEKLGIDFFVGEIIHKETKKAISKINPDLLLIN